MQDLNLFGLEQLGVFFHRRLPYRQRFRRQAVMQRQRGFLVFEQKAGNIAGQPREHLPHRIRQGLAAR